MEMFKDYFVLEKQTGVFKLLEDNIDSSIRF